MDPSQVSELSPFELTDLVADYAYERFRWYKAGCPLNKGPLPPPELNTALVADCDILAERMAMAHQHRSKSRASEKEYAVERFAVALDWDADNYVKVLAKRPEGLSDGEQHWIATLYPAPATTLLTTPHVIMDRHNRELVWYVPECLSKRRQAWLFHSSRHLNDSFLSSFAEIPMDSQCFAEPGTCSPDPGVVNFSPAWFENEMPTPQHMLEILPTLKPGNVQPGTQLWLEETTESFALLGAFLFIAHPELFAAGRAALRHLIADPTLVRDGDAVVEVIKQWASPLPVISVISNPSWPLPKGITPRADFYELLTTVGPYGYGRIFLPNLGLDLQYDGGTVVGMCGNVVNHGLPAADGDRVCIAQYLHAAFLKRVGVGAAGWPVMGKYVVPKGDHLSMA